MSKMARTDRKPPLARSPIRLRSRRVLQSTANAASQTPPGSLMKTQTPKRTWVVEEPELRPEYHTISCELRALAKMVHRELGTDDEMGGAGCALRSNRSPLFERGRFYEEYSARRNERLKRKKGGMEDEKKKHVYDLGVRVESAKRREVKKFESLRKTVPSTPMTEVRREAPRYMLRSSTSKENKKPSLPMNFETSAYVTKRKTTATRARKS